MCGRTVYYSAKMITEQIKKGGDYKLKKVISIIITDYNFIIEEDDYHNVYELRNKKSNAKFLDIMEINILELPKIPQNTDNTGLWDWLQFLKSEKEDDLEMLALKNPNIQKAVGILKELSHDERTRLLYEEREKARHDEQARYNGAVEQTKISIAKRLILLKIPFEDISKSTELPIEAIEAIAEEYK